MKKTIFIIIMGLLCFTINGQNDIRPGMIINNQGDTLVGQLDYQGDISNAKLIHFINKNVDSIFLPYQINGYKFDDGKYYISKTAIFNNDTVKIFAECLVKGKKDLYFTRSLAGFYYLISRTDSIILELPYKKDYIKKNDVVYEFENKAFIGYLKAYFSDCPELTPKIESLYSPNRHNLISLTKEYHDITCGEGNCTVFEKKKNPIRFSFEPLLTYYIKSDILGDFSATYGFNLIFWIPNSSENMSIRTGIIRPFSKLRMTQIPLQFEYVLPYKKVSPKFDIGVNSVWIRDSYNNAGTGLTFLIGTGLYFKPSEVVSIAIDLNSDIFAFYPDFLFIESKSVLGTLYLKAGINITISKY